MRVGIDISQLAYPETGVANFLENLVMNLVKEGKENEYVLFFSSLRKNIPHQISHIKYPNVCIRNFKLPPLFLDLLWNKLHIVPIEWFIGPIDVFISSDWLQPPTNARKITILYDLVVYKYPEETAKKIIEVHKRKLKWVKKEVDKIICISISTKKDAMKILNIPEDRFSVIYPGL